MFFFLRLPPTQGTPKCALESAKVSTTVASQISDLPYFQENSLPTSCWVTGCDNRDKKISFVSFHRFPDGKQEPNRRKQWIEFCERNISAEPSWTDGICSEHFDVKSFSKRTKSLTGDGRIWLFINAVPNLSPPSTLVEKREERQKGKRYGYTKSPPIISDADSDLDADITSEVPDSLPDPQSPDDSGFASRRPRKHPKASPRPRIQRTAKRRSLPQPDALAAKAAAAPEVSRKIVRLLHKYPVHQTDSKITVMNLGPVSSLVPHRELLHDALSLENDLMLRKKLRKISHLIDCRVKTRLISRRDEDKLLHRKALEIFLKNTPGLFRSLPRLLPSRSSSPEIPTKSNRSLFFNNCPLPFYPTENLLLQAQAPSISAIDALIRLSALTAPTTASLPAADVETPAPIKMVLQKQYVPIKMTFKRVSEGGENFEEETISRQLPVGPLKKYKREKEAMLLDPPEKERIKKKTKVEKIVQRRRPKRRGKTFPLKLEDIAVLPVPDYEPFEYEEPEVCSCHCSCHG